MLGFSVRLVSVGPVASAVVGFATDICRAEVERPLREVEGSMVDLHRQTILTLAALIILTS